MYTVVGKQSSDYSFSNICWWYKLNQWRRKHELWIRKKENKQKTSHCTIGYNEFDFFKKMKNIDSLMGANLKSKTQRSRNLSNHNIHKVK
jgi:hypothetical protein